MTDQPEIELEPGGKPTYRNKHACVGCGTGFLDCAAFAVSSLKCCRHCSHPTRWTTHPPYTDAELTHMLGRSEEQTP